MSKTIKLEDVKRGDRVRITREVTVDGTTLGMQRTIKADTGKGYFADGATIELLERKPTIPDDALFLTWVYDNGQGGTSWRNYAHRIKPNTWVEDDGDEYTTTELLEYIDGAPIAVLAVKEVVE